VHQYLRFIPTTVVVGSGIQYLTLLTNEVSLKYFKTGKFELKVPFLCNIAEEGPRPKFDFIGVQYYARPVIGLTGPTSYHEPMTQMPFREDPEGIKEAIVETHKATGKPVIVTENGISTHDPVQRNRYMLRALYATREAAKVIGEENFWGYFVWSFGDNLEWDMGMKPQAFGLYALTEKGLALDPKPGTETLQKVAEASKRALQPVAAAA
jgi:beta-glucosidase